MRAHVSDRLGCSVPCGGGLVRLPRAARVPSSPAQPCCSSTASSSISHLSKGNTHLSRVNKRLSRVNKRLSTVNKRPSTVNKRPSTVNKRLSTVNKRPSTVNKRLSTVNKRDTAAIRVGDTRVHVRQPQLRHLQHPERPAVCLRVHSRARRAPTVNGFLGEARRGDVSRRPPSRSYPDRTA
jgi:septal ring factor EnvC (AmiA/AmiB activator)